MSEKRFKLDSELYEIYDYDKLMALKEVVELLNEQQATITALKKENERLKNKLNVTALELVDEAISMGKAVEISEMNYHEFLEYRQKKGKPMELQK